VIDNDRDEDTGALGDEVKHLAQGLGL
jgi:hypothetical protein